MRPRTDAVGSGPVRLTRAPAASSMPAGSREGRRVSLAERPGPRVGTDQAGREVAGLPPGGWRRGSVRR